MSSKHDNEKQIERDIVKPNQMRYELKVGNLNQKLKNITHSLDFKFREIFDIHTMFSILPKLHIEGKSIIEQQ